MCYHAGNDWLKNLNWDQYHIAQQIQWWPVGLRQHIRHIVALPGPERSGSAYNYNATVVITGNAELQDIIGAAAQTLGTLGYKNDTEYWSKHPLKFSQLLTIYHTNITPKASKSWLDAYAPDTAVINEKARLSQADNFKQLTAIAMTDVWHSGKPWSVVFPDIERVMLQMNAIQRDFENYFWVGENVTCAKRPLEDSPVGLPHELPDF